MHFDAEAIDFIDECLVNVNQLKSLRLVTRRLRTLPSRAPRDAGRAALTRPPPPSSLTAGSADCTVCSASSYARLTGVHATRSEPNLKWS